MSKDKKYVVTDEGEIVEEFNNKKDAQIYTNKLLHDNAIKDIKENLNLDYDEISQYKIDEWIANRGTVEYRPKTDEDE